MALPLYLTVPGPLFMSMVVYYHLLAPRFLTEKQRAYLLSTLSATVMSIISLPFFFTYLTSGFEGMYLAGQKGWMGVLSEVGVIVFGVYLFGAYSSTHLIAGTECIC